MQSTANILLKSWLNGKKTDVFRRLHELPIERAFFCIAYMTERLSQMGRHDLGMWNNYLEARCYECSKN